MDIFKAVTVEAAHENLARWIWSRLEPALPNRGSIIVFKTCTAGCVYEDEDD